MESLRISSCTILLSASELALLVFCRSETLRSVGYLIAHALIEPPMAFCLRLARVARLLGGGDLEIFIRRS